MTILAVCGPIGGNFKGFTDTCLSFLKSDNVVMIDCSKYGSVDDLLVEIKSETKDVIVFGTEMLIDERLLSACDVRVFLECDPTSCLINLVRELESSGKANKLNALLDEYTQVTKLKNENICYSAKKFDFCFPENFNLDTSFNLLIDKKEQKLIPPKFNRANFSDKLNFFTPDYGFEKKDQVKTTATSISSL